MERPSVKNVLKDTSRNITYEVMAYRELTRPELLLVVRTFRSTKEGRKVKANSVVQFDYLADGNRPF